MLEPLDDHPLLQPSSGRTYLQTLEDALDRAYQQARRHGYQPGSPEMEALVQAENRYQQAKADC